MRILGIDPGTHRLGWGVIAGTAGSHTYVGSGCIESPPHAPAERYLPHIHQHLTEIITTYQPDILGLESLLFQKNISTAIPVAEARGIIRLTAATHRVLVIESAPNTIKLAVTGSGNASKAEVKRMIGLLLRIKTETKLDDELDALAVAISTIVTNK